MNKNYVQYDTFTDCCSHVGYSNVFPFAVVKDNMLAHICICTGCSIVMYCHCGHRTKCSSDKMNGPARRFRS